MSQLLNAVLELPPIYARVESLPREVPYLMGCASLEQFCNTLRGLIDPEGFCPFCKNEHVRRNRISIYETGGWRLFNNEFPNKKVAKMALITPMAHLTNPSELTPDDWQSIGELFGIWRAAALVSGGGMLMRFGEPNYHVGTIDHLHINLIEPVPGVGFRPPLAKDQKELAADYERMIGYRDTLIRHHGVGWLFSPEGIAATLPKPL